MIFGGAKVLLMRETVLLLNNHCYEMVRGSNQKVSPLSTASNATADSHQNEADNYCPIPAKSYLYCKRQDLEGYIGEEQG